MDFRLQIIPHNLANNIALFIASTQKILSFILNYLNSFCLTNTYLFLNFTFCYICLIVACETLMGSEC